MRLGQHGLGFPFLFFSNCGYKIKRLLGFVPMFFLFFFAKISIHSIGMYQLNRRQHEVNYLSITLRACFVLRLAGFNAGLF